MMIAILRAPIVRLLLLAALLAMTACGSLPSILQAASPEADIPEIIMKGHDFAFEGPDKVEAGLVKITLENHGKEAHQANLGRLPEGKTLTDFFAAFQENELQGLAMLEFVGGPNAVEPHERQETIINLEPGTYLWICFVLSSDGVRHAVKGMMKPLVVAGTGVAQPVEPMADLSLTLRDFDLELPDEVAAGTFTWKVTNEGPEPHEITLVKLAEGKSVEDMVAYMRAPIGPPPFTFAGGIGGMSAGRTAWVTLTLTPGEYVAFCPIPSFAHGGQAHHDLGMIKLLRVTDAVTDAGSGLAWPWLVGILGLMAVGTGTAVFSRNRQKSAKTIEDLL